MCSADMIGYVYSVLNILFAIEPAKTPRTPKAQRDQISPAQAIQIYQI